MFCVQEARDDELERVVKNYSELNLTQPMPGCPEHLARHLLHHGDLRLRDPHTKMDVHVFLFTDLLLITKVTQRKAEKVKVSGGGPQLVPRQEGHQDDSRRCVVFSCRCVVMMVVNVVQKCVCGGGGGNYAFLVLTLQ